MLYLLLSLGLSLFYSQAAYATQAISSNPAAVNITPGNGALQKYLEPKLGIKNNYGIHFDGAWVANTNYLLSGGIPNPNRWTNNSSLILGMTIDTEQFMSLKGGLFGAQVLQFNGQTTNKESGIVQGYNSLPAGIPVNRTELYQIWYRQKLFHDKLIVRVGKVAPTLDFNNVVKPVPLSDSQVMIPAVSSLLYIPIFVNPTLLGILPGYYNSAFGITANFIPQKEWYVNMGIYDGALAQGIQTGLTGPNHTGSYFKIAETGITWTLGKNQLPGTFALGAWHQAGLISILPNLTSHGASGYYLFGSQRLWYKNPGANDSGISGFYQFGANNSRVMIAHQYVGGGLTFFGLVPKRIDDSMGLGAAYSWVNHNFFAKSTELLTQAYYQASIMNGIYLQPTLSYSPHPAEIPNLNAAWAATLGLIVLF